MHAARGECARFGPRDIDAHDIAPLNELAELRELSLERIRLTRWNLCRRQRRPRVEHREETNVAVETSGTQLRADGLHRLGREPVLQLAHADRLFGVVHALPRKRLDDVPGEVAVCAASRIDVLLDQDVAQRVRRVERHRVRRGERTIQRFARARLDQLGRLVRATHLGHRVARRSDLRGDARRNALAWRR